MITKLSNKFLEICIDSKGAELTSIRRTDTQMEYLCPKDKPIWQEQAPILFPIMGKLKDDFYTLHGQKYEMGTHGFGRFMEFDYVKINELQADFTLHSGDETKKIYPFDFLLKISYRLENEVIYISTELQNLSDEELYYSIGFHPGFTCPIEPQLKAEDYSLRFYPPVTAKKAIMDGYMIKELRDEFKAVEYIPINEELFSHGAITLSDLSTHRIELVNSLSDHYIRIDFKDFPQLAIWTPEGQKISYVCIEPRCGLQDFTNTDHMIAHKAGMIAVGEKEKKYKSFSITVK